ncbi:MAG: nucleotidyltransferase family protein [Oscillospiraceae bacterium]|jgi:predicted nucleotidyltransferase|nr:nucleotidyltransferase family protein [Oscillospiraceae bacterium]
MFVAGIVAEYNPFHHGHAWHIAQTRAAGATHIVAVMSGATVQRGEFAIAGKAVRARMALENGVDLVLCLPTPWSCARAQDFARASVHLLGGLGMVDALSFGSESGDLPLLRRAVAGLRERGVEEKLRAAAGEGKPFAQARQTALAQCDPAAAALLRSPNDTLNVEYLTALAQQGSTMEAIVIPRKGAGHDAATGGAGFRSAYELRKIFRAGELQAGDCPSGQLLLEEAAAGRAPVLTERLDVALLARLRTTTPEALAALPDVSEGLEHRIFTAAQQAGSAEELLRLAGAKRYPTARLRRILFHALLGVTSADFAQLPAYLEVLGCNAAGHELLRLAKQSATLPIVQRRRDLRRLPEEAQKGAALEYRAASLMQLAQSAAPQ